MDAVLLAGLTFVLGIATNWATSRRTLALQYDTELRRERLAVYADLWSRLEVLNKYGRSSSRLSRVDTEKLVADLKRWYFQVGGIYLSEPTRNDYFALQDALQHALATARAERGELESAGDEAFEFVRLRASRLRTSLTRDVGTHKVLKLRGEPNRPPLPSELGPRWQDPENATMELSRRRPCASAAAARPARRGERAVRARTREVGGHALGQRRLGDPGRARGGRQAVRAAAPARVESARGRACGLAARRRGGATAARDVDACARLGWRRASDRARDERHGLEAFVVVDHHQFPMAAGGTRMLPT